MVNFYAVGWKLSTSSQAGQLDNFRKAHFTDGFEEYKEAIQFPSCPTEQSNSTIEKFENAITGLENVETNGNNTDVPFYRKITEAMVDEYARFNKITEQLEQELNPFTDFEKVRLYIITEKLDEIEYRFYVKALRTTQLTTRFILTNLDKEIKITDTKGNGKALPYTICYAEKILNDEVIQYIFNVQDYEAIFGLNEKKLSSAKATCDKFLAKDGISPEFKISGEFIVKISGDDKDKITAIIEGKRKIANALSKYNNEAADYDWEDVKKANEFAKEFNQVPFTYNEEDKQIFLTAESFEAWVSVITNTKKLAIASGKLEDKIADGRTTKADFSTNSEIN